MNYRKYQHKEDRELLAYFYKDRNNEWLGILLQRYTMLLFGVCMKYLKNEDEAKEAVQQVYLKVIAALQNYPVDYFKSWLYMVAKNYCLMKLRDKAKQPYELNEQLMAAPEDPVDLQALAYKDKTLEYMSAALLQLNKEQQVCVTLFYLEKKTYQQIAEHTGYSMLQVKSHIQNGKRNLKLIIERLRQDGR